MTNSTSNVPGFPSPATLTDLRQLKVRGRSIPNNPMSAGVPGTGASGVAKLKAAMQAAATNNGYVNEPYLRAPVWAANTTYFAGQVVSSTDGANAFLCRTGGASAASGNGPTGNGLAIVVDNAARWEWIGAIRGLGYNVASATAWAAGTAYNTIGTLVASSDGYNVYISRSVGTSAAAPAVGPIGFNPGEIIQDGTVTWQWFGFLASKPIVSFVTATDITNAITQAVTNVPSLADPIVKWSGGVFEINPSGGGTDVRGPNIGQAASPVYLGGSGASMTFWYDGQRIAFRGPNAIFTGDPTVMVEINDRRVFDGVLTHPGALINPGGMMLDLGAFGSTANKKVRIITNSSFVNIGSKQIITEPTAALWVEEPTNGTFSLAVEGDSLTQGGYNSPFRPGDDWVSYVAANLGAVTYANMAVGGTGFISDNGGTKSTYLQRLQRLASTNPDVLVIAGCHNDVTYTAEEQSAAYLTYFQAVRAALPSALIVVFGNNLLRDETPPAANYQAELTGETLLKAAFDLWADPNSVFVPILTSVDGPWTYGAGSSNAPAPSTELTLASNINNAASGTLTANFTGSTGWYRLSFQTGVGVVYKVATLTNGSTAITNIRNGTGEANSNITTTGTALTANPGNAVRFYDATTTDGHPMQRGYTYYGYRYLAALRAVINGL